MNQKQILFKRNRTKRRSIKKTLLVGIIGLSVSISVLCGITYAILMYRDATNNMNTRLEENVSAYNTAVQNAIQIYKTKIEAIAQNSSIIDKTKSSSEISQTLAQLAKQYGFATLAVADADGNANDGGKVSQREYFQKSMKGETYISSTLVSSTTGKTVLIVSAKINNGGYSGVVIATLDSDTFSKMVDNISIGDSGYGFIVDKDGKIIAHKNRDTVTSQVNYVEKAKKDSSYSSQAGVIKDMINGKSGIEYETFQGTKQAVCFASIPDADGWSIGVVAVVPEMMRNFYISVGFTIALIILFIILSIFIAFRIADPIVKPIVGLVQRTEALAAGDLHSDVPQVNTRDELETLSTSFTNTVNSLNAYIGEISMILSSLAKGDCTAQAVQNYQGDFVQISDSLQQIVSNLNMTFGNIIESSNQVAIGSQQVSSAAQSLAAGSTEQAATVEELNASIASVFQEAKQNTSNVHTATEYAKQAESCVTESNMLMQKLNAAMQEIGDTSQQISQITKLVEDIAFQTNILALNAAVEAARAGSAGKGFAVVAEEVRNLAEKSSEASKKTSDLIQKSVAAVSKGKQLSNDTLSLLSTVAEKTKMVDQVILQIEQASSAQTNAITQINQGLSQVSSVVQANAATAEESSASSEELSSQAQIMKQMMAKFKIKNIFSTDRKE